MVRNIKCLLLVKKESIYCCFSVLKKEFCGINCWDIFIVDLIFGINMSFLLGCNFIDLNNFEMFKKGCEGGVED